MKKLKYVKLFEDFDMNKLTKMPPVKDEHLEIRYKFTNTPSLKDAYVELGYLVSKQMDSILTTGLLSVFDGNGGMYSVKVEDVGNGWFRYNTTVDGNPCLCCPKTYEVVELCHPSGGLGGILVYDFVRNNPR